MELQRPLCRNPEPHDPHGFWVHGYTVWNECPGWSRHHADVTALAEKLTGICRDAGWPMGLPPGIRMECHPSVTAAIQRMVIPSFAEFQSSFQTGEDVLKPQIPVLLGSGMTVGQWQIIADEGLIAEGVVSLSA